jgi:DNA sulfur modification protein DndB
MFCATVRELTTGVTRGKVNFREVNHPQVRAIKRYIFDSAEKEQVYFTPLVANLEERELEDGLNGKISIIDGSHRLKAFMQLEMMMKEINSDNEDEVKKGYKLLTLLNNTKLCIQVFEGFSSEEKDQLYIDLNTKGKKVSLSKRIAYDSRNHINQITNHVLRLNEQLQIAGVELEKSAIIRPGNTKLLSLTQLRQIIGIFLTGKLMHSTAEFKLKLPLKSEQYIRLIDVWLDELFTLCPAAVIGDYHESMLASYPLLISVAFYVNQGHVSASYEKRENTIRERMAHLKELDLNRENSVWERFAGSFKGKDQYFYLANNKKNIEKLVKWLQKQGR